MPKASAPTFTQTVRHYLLAAAKWQEGKDCYFAVVQRERQLNNSHYTQTPDGYQTADFSMLPNSPNIAVNTGATPVHNAIVDCNPVKLKEMLVKVEAPSMEHAVGCYTGQGDPFRSTPMILLVRTLQTSYLLAFLRKAVAEADAGRFNLADLQLGLRDKAGRTLLHYAYALGQVRTKPEHNVVHQLLEIDKRLPEGQKITGITDNEGLTPLALALQMDEKAVRKMLIDLEMHPDRSVGATYNSLQTEFFETAASAMHTGVNAAKALRIRDGSIAFSGPNALPLILLNKGFLEGLQRCSDYAHVFGSLQTIITDHVNSKLKGPTIGEQCWQWVQYIQQEHRKTLANASAAPSSVAVTGSLTPTPGAGVAPAR